MFEGTGQIYPFDVPEGGFYAFGRPAIGLRGPIVGFANESTCDPEGVCATIVRAIDMRHAGTSRETINFGYAGPRHHRLVKIGSLRVAKTGTRAWITCPEPNRSNVAGVMKPTCVRPGAGDHVYTLAAGNRSLKSTHLKGLDSGKTIYPGSLRLSGRSATWRHGRTVHHAQLPKPAE